MNSVRFVSLRPCEKTSFLAPTPSLNDWDHINERLEGVRPIESHSALESGTHEIRATYRNYTVYLYPNAWFTRTNPKTKGINEYAGWPSETGYEEDVRVYVNDDVFKGRVMFV
jgi:hypothetical protein